MSEPFPVVRKGYDPEAVESFVQNQADAWRARLDDAVGAFEEWQRRANALAERAAELEARIRQMDADHEEAVSHLGSAVAEMRWSRDQAVAEMAEMRQVQDSVGRDADAIIGQAQVEAVRVVAAAEEEAQRWFAAARRRIEMAEAHAGSLRQATAR